ncbi:MAG: hypothetical protein M1814_003532 [Vezdaea aestivalis]|nr:MAG: hypothetical protein M1814_003532 [Vezdaea aestivalis]
MSPIGPVPIPQVPRKRPSTYGETPPSTGRQLQPRPSFTPMNNGEDPGPQLSPDQSSDPNQPARKKRGRPTKAEAEERKRDAMAKGIPYPQQRTPKTPKPLKPLEGGSSTDPTTAPGGSTAATPATSGPPPLSALAPAPPLSSTPVTAPFQPPSAPILSTPDPSPANKRKRPKKSEESTPNPMGIGGPSSALSSLSTQPVHGQMSSSPARRSPVRLAPRTEGLTRTAEVPMTMLLEGSEGRRPGALTTSGPSAAAPPPPPTQNPAGPLPQAEPQSRPPPQESIQTSQPPRELPK